MNIRDYIDDIARSVAFLSRVHVPQRHFVNFDGRLSRALRAFPVAGLLIALPPAAIVSVLCALGTDPLLTAVLAIAVLTLITGALHEDGLADTADGFGGGRDRERALTIMKDSRIGTYGATALVLAFGLRTAALAALIPHFTPTAAGLAVLAAAVLSRSAMVWHWSQMPPARTDGVAASAGVPETSAVQVALASGLGIGAALLLLSGTGFITAVIALAACASAIAFFHRMTLRKIGGYTGDTIGATQQLGEIALLAALAVAA